MSALVATMNNNGPPHDPNPFGYQFTYNEPYSEPSDIPVNGPPLLNNNENIFLGDFFTNPANFQFDFGFSQHLHQPQQEDLNWILNEPAPTLLQASAATPAPKAASPPVNNYHGLPQSSAFDYHSFNDANNVAAGNGHDHIIHSPHTIDLQSIQPPQQPVHVSPQAVSAPPIKQSIENSQTPQSLPPSATEPSFNAIHQPAITSPKELVFPDAFAHAMPHNFFQQPQLPQKQKEEVTDARLYRFGTDSHFTDDGFRFKKDGKKLERELLADLYIVHPSISADNTRAPTPESTMEVRKRERDDDEDELDSDFSAKRRKDTDTGSADRARMHNRRPSAPVRGSTGQTTPPAARRRISAMDPATVTRRRSSAGPTRPPRENLSEEQKRNNHIMSEQKRRNLIKQGFDELQQMVPELRPGGLSKSQMLTEAGNFLEKLLNTNQELRQLIGVEA